MSCKYWRQTTGDCGWGPGVGGSPDRPPGDEGPGYEEGAEVGPVPRDGRGLDRVTSLLGLRPRVDVMSEVRPVGHICRPVRSTDSGRVDQCFVSRLGVLWVLVVRHLLFLNDHKVPGTNDNGFEYKFVLMKDEVSPLGQPCGKVPGSGYRKFLRDRTPTGKGSVLSVDHSNDE